MKEYVDKSILLKKIQDYKKLAIHTGETQAFVTADAIESIVKKTFPENVRPVTRGEWEVECQPDGTPYCLHCSVCDKEWAKICITSFYAYCPFCGAEMGGKTDG